MTYFCNLYKYNTININTHYSIISLRYRIVDSKKKSRSKIEKEIDRNQNLYQKTADRIKILFIDSPW